MWHEAIIISGQIKTDAAKPPSSPVVVLVAEQTLNVPFLCCARSRRFEASEATYRAAAASPLWPPSLRLLGGSCQSFWISPRQPCPRRSPCSPWLRTHDQASTDQQGGEKRGEEKKKSEDLRWRCRADVPATVECSSCLHGGANAALSGVLAHVTKKSTSLLSSKFRNSL